MNTIHDERDIDRLRLNTYAYAVLIAWSQQGLIDQLANGEAFTAHDLNADAHAVRNTAPVLAHLGLLIRHPQPDGGTAWSLSHSARGLIESGVLPNPQHWDGFDNLTRLQAVLEHGGPVRDREGHSRVTSGGVVESNPKQTRGFMDMLFRRSADSAFETARLLAPWATDGRALDLGGGHGRYGHEISKHGIDVTLFDRAVCCEIANERYGDDMKTRAGDFMKDDLDGPYDLVLMSNIVHGCAPEELELLLPRVRAATNPGGILAIKDMFLDETMASPESAALFGLVMLMYTDGGRSYSRQEIAALVRAAGFEQVDFIDVHDQRFSLLLAS
jgi:hypothetical protein